MASHEAAATITPQPDGGECDADGCTVAELLSLVEPDGTGESRALCPTHRVEYLREVSER